MPNEKTTELLNQAKALLEQCRELADETNESFEFSIGGVGVEYVPITVAYRNYQEDYGDEDMTLEEFKNRETYNEYGEYEGHPHGWNNDAWLPSSAFC